MFSKSVFFRIVLIAIFAVMLSGIGLLSGCAAFVSDDVDSSKAEDNNPTAAEECKQDKIMAEFKALAGENPKPDTIIKFMDKNISGVSKEDASKMIEELEKVQKNYLPTLEEKYYNGESVQNGLMDIYEIDFDINRIYDTEEAELKSLLAETRDMGFKVETTEGMFFPIINYEFMKKYTPFAAGDIKGYIDIMAEESNKVPAKDAGLMIGWDEIIKRALAQEEFIVKHGSSAKAESIKKLQKKYISFILHGLDNTPLFWYDTKIMVPEAREAYEKAVKDNENSELAKLLGKYMEILEKSGYKQSKEADEFRKDVLNGK